MAPKPSSSYTAPTIKLHVLSKADGSASYTSPGATHALTVGVNYPLEVPFRSDEDPESTYVEVSVRPHNGVAMVRERYIEEIVRKTLQTVIIGEDTPRCMLQVTVQVADVEIDESLPGGVKGGYQGEGCLDRVVGAVNASVLACLDGAVRMKGFVGALLIGVLDDGHLVVSPNVTLRKRCESLHAFGFASNGRCVLMQSEGGFDLEVWQKAELVARHAVCGTTGAAKDQEDVNMDMDTDTDTDTDMELTTSDNYLFAVMRRSVEARVMQDGRWKA